MEKNYIKLAERNGPKRTTPNLILWPMRYSRRASTAASIQIPYLLYGILRTLMKCRLCTYCFRMGYIAGAN